MIKYANYSKKARFFAFILDIVTSPLSFINLKRKNVKIEKILVVRPDNMGDLTMSIDALYSLKKSLVDAKLDLITPSWNKEIVKRLNFINSFYFINLKSYCFNDERNTSVIELLRVIRDIRKKKYDVFLDLRGDFKLVFLFGWLGRVKIRRGFGNLGARFLLNDTIKFNRKIHFYEQNFNIVERFITKRLNYIIPITESEKKKADDICLKYQLEKKRFVIIHPAVSKYWKTKKWDETNFVKISNYIISKYGLEIVVVTGPKEIEVGQRIASALPRAVALTGKLSVMEFVALLKYSTLLISNDSAPMHFAVNQNLPVLAIFGPTDYRRSGPFPLGGLFNAIEGKENFKRPLFGVNVLDREYFPSVNKVIDKIDSILI